MVTYLVIVFTAQSPASDFTTPCPRLELSEWLLWSLTPNWLLQNLTPEVLTSFVLPFRSHRFLRAQLFVWFSRQNRQRKVVYTLLCRFKDVGDKIPSLINHPWTHGETHTYLSIYLSIYHSGEGIYGFRSYNAKIFEQIEPSGIW